LKQTLFFTLQVNTSQRMNYRIEYNRVYKKDRFELIFDFIIVNLNILRFICVIAFMVIQIILELYKYTIYFLALIYIFYYNIIDE